MSSDHDLERLLRDARGTLPEPSERVSEKARASALAAIRARRPRRFRVAALVGASVVLAIALGIGIGALVTPSGEAAKGPVGLGFLPAPGWLAFQTGGEASPILQTVAVASNVPLAADDSVAGVVEPSGLPYATLLNLPPEGILIQASFTRRSSADAWARQAFPMHSLPLRLRDATPYIQSGTQIRPEEPLGQYQLRAEVNGHHVDVHVYFGTPRPSATLRAAAQRQLDRLVVDRQGGAARSVARKPASASTPSAPGLVDRTFVCTPAFVGGIYKVEPHGHRGSGRRGSTWRSPAFAALSTTVSGAAVTALDNEIVWLTAGRPAADALLVPSFGVVEFPTRTWGTIGVNRKLCKASKAKVPLTRKGLTGGGVGTFDERWDCAAPRRVLLRVRAVLQTKSALQSYRSFVRTTVPVKSAQFSLRTTSGKPLAYAQVLESGKSLLYTSPTCFPD